MKSTQHLKVVVDALNGMKDTWEGCCDCDKIQETVQSNDSFDHLVKEFFSGFPHQKL